MYFLECLLLVTNQGVVTFSFFVIMLIFVITWVNFFQVPMARASILWLLGEYSERVPKVAPDVLRKMAKTFGTEVS